MAEEFQAGICGGNWWNSSRSVFAAASPCSVGLNNDVAGFGWPNNDHMVDMKLQQQARSSSGETNSICDTTTTSNNMTFQEVVQIKSTDSLSGTGGLLIDSTLQMMGFGLSNSPTSSDFNQPNLLRSSTGSNLYSMLHEENMATKLNNYRQAEIGLDTSQIQKGFSAGGGGVVDGSMNGFKSNNSNNNNQDLSLDQASSGGECALSSQGLSAGFPAISSAPYGYTSANLTLLQNLFDGEITDHQPQQSYCNNRSMNYSSSTTTADYVSNNNIMSTNTVPNSNWPRLISPFLSRPSQQPLKQQHGSLHFSNNTPFWNASALGAGPNDTIRAGLFHSTTTTPQPQRQYLTPTSFEGKPKCNNISAKSNSNEDVQDAGSVVKKSGTDQPVLKRPRIETPSPLPTFKVRKEKLGDRITALQQLVSPFGKTDTASVLHEAIEYIKFLHDQVSALSSPYMKNGTPVQVVHQQGSNKLKDQDQSPKQDLKSRGLCLVPISSTFPVANETTADFWTPTFGGTFR